ncbi:hypothetical protein [Acinetobacter guerrae]|uniref:hypothetical protein n=1 Tax=Acinetobacter guerrae TaxID=1843371 RepID=UPI00125F9386|nr:hypothetical protein [Acinetobacter guerrae]
MEENKSRNNLNVANNLGLIELLTLSFFLSVGVSLLYKCGFYSTLGISWYLNNLSPQYLFISSLKFVVPIFLSFLVGAFLSLKFSKVTNGSIFQILFFLFLIASYLLIKYISSLLLISLLTIFIFAFFVDSLKNALPVIRLIMTEDTEPRVDILKSILMIMLIFNTLIIIYIPFAYGKIEALEVKENKVVLSQASLNGDKRNWLILEVNGDKALVMDKVNKSIFRVVEYKEIKDISVK